MKLTKGIVKYLCNFFIIVVDYKFHVCLLWYDLE